MLTGEITGIINHAIKKSNDINRVSVRESGFNGYVMLISFKAKDYFNFGMCTSFKRNHFLTVIIIIDCLLSILVVTYDLLTAMIFFSIALFMILWVIGLSTISAQKNIEDKVVSYGFANNGFYLRDSDGILRILWNKIHVKQTKSYYFLYYSWFAGFTIPKRELNHTSEMIVKGYIEKYQLLKKPAFRKWTNQR